MKRDDAIERALVGYFRLCASESDDFRQFDDIRSDIEQRINWPDTFWDGDLRLDVDGELLGWLDELVVRGVLEADDLGQFGFRLARHGTRPSIDGLQPKIDSTDWTGLGKRASAEDILIVRSHAKDLLQAIIQSDADIQSRTDACKRVEAALVLLEAPNVPWREIVGLLNHPSVTATLAALNLLQLILGLAT